jgi:hypothetical protein
MVKRFMPIVGNQSPFKQIIDQQSVLANTEKKKVRASLYASDYGQCQRKVWYQFFPEMYPAEVIDAQTARIFENGNNVHERLGKYLKAEKSIQFVEEINVPRDELDVHGRCDGIATFDCNFYVLEFKSINSKVVEEAKAEHEGQLMWYLHMFEELRRALRQQYDIPDGVVVDESERVSFEREGLGETEIRLLLSQGPVAGEILYEAKSNQKIFPFSIEYDSAKALAIKAWFAQLKGHVDEVVRPEVRYDKTTYPCSFAGKRCAYWQFCHGEEAQRLM